MITNIKELLLSNSYEEKLYNGALISCGYNAAGYPLDVLSNFPTHLDRRFYTEPFSFNIEIDGRSIDYNLDFVDFSVDKNEERVHGILTLDSRIVPIRLRVHTLLDGTQMFTRYIEIENLSEKNLVVSRLSLISGGLEDMETEKLIHQAIDSVIKNRTTIIIAHRLASIKNADKIVVLDEGTVAEVGTHEELCRTCEEYAKMVKLQKLEDEGGEI